MSDGVVIVTGASGFIASHVVKLLLEQGYKVRGTVRSLENQEKVEPLKKLVKDSENNLELVEVDLTKDEGWEKAMSGCVTLIHTASPFPNVIEKNVAEEEVVVPAKEGTLRALKAAVSAKIKTVVLTSSCASVIGTADPIPDKVYSEEDWTNPEDPTIDVYTKSKVLAEKAAWEFLKELPDNEKFNLAVINPSLVFGPILLESNKNCTSAGVMSQILTKAVAAYPKLAMPFCDVRDVAQAHVKAISNPEAHGKRHIISTNTMWFRDIVAVVAKEFTPQGYSISTVQLPYFMCWAISFFNKQVRNIVLPRFGKTVSLSNKRMVEVLGIEPTPMEKTLNDMAYSMIDIGIVKKSKNFKEPETRN